jgi:peptidoglycan hydrolase-like protein with peptidoglycan-binding domain
MKRQQISLMVVIVFLVLFGVTVNVSAASILKVGSRGSEVITLQTKLNQLGYNAGQADGVFGQTTKNAVISLQKAKKITADGIVGSATWKVLNTTVTVTSSRSSSITLKVGSKGDVVKTLQTKLNQLGYSCGTADGIYGTGTKNAVASFQKANGLTADGIAGSQTQAKLASSTTKAATVTEVVTTTTSNTGTATISGKLTMGDTGSSVKALQQRLNDLGFSTTVDGIYGSGTRRTLINYQLTRGLTPDGIAGTETIARLCSSNGGTSTYTLPAFDATTNVTRNEYNAWKPDSGKINLVWQANFNYQIVNDAINVIAPVWFNVAMKDGSVHVTGEGSIASVNTWHAEGYQTWATIQSFTPGYTKLIVSNNAIGNQIIQELVDAVQTYGLDGINIDFENMDPADKNLYTAFITRAANTLHQYGAVVSVDVSNDSDALVNWWTDSYHLAGLGQAADYVALMTYDQYTDTPGPSAASWWVEKTVSSVVQQIPANKLIMGIPLYAYDYINGGSSKKALTLGDFETLKQTGQLCLVSGEVWTVSEWIVSPKYNESTGTQYMKFKDTAGRTHEAWYENAQSIEIKLDIINCYQLAGAASWRYGFSNDFQSIWDVYAGRLK